MRIVRSRSGFLAIAVAVTALTADCFKLPPTTRFSSRSSSDFHFLNTPGSSGATDSLRRERGIALAAGVEDYGPQFASYLQNDVTPYTVGKKK